MYSEMEMDMLMPLLGIYIGILAVVLVLAVVDYIFGSIGMYRIAKLRGMSSPWLAYIPYARTYLLGKIAGPIYFVKKKIKEPGIWLIVFPFAFSALIGVLFFIYMMILIGSVAAHGQSPEALGAAIGGLIGFYVLIILVSVAGQAVLCMLNGLVYYQIFKRYTVENMAIVHVVLGLFIPLYSAICLFVMRNRIPFTPCEKSEEPA